MKGVFSCLLLIAYIISNLAIFKLTKGLPCNGISTNETIVIKTVIHH